MMKKARGAEESSTTIGGRLLASFHDMGGRDFLVPGIDTQAVSKEDDKALRTATRSLQGDADKLLLRLHTFPNLRHLTLHTPKVMLLPFNNLECKHVEHMVLRLSNEFINLVPLVSRLGLQRLRTLEIHFTSFGLCRNLLMHGGLVVHGVECLILYGSMSDWWEDVLPAMTNLRNLKINDRLKLDVGILRKVRDAGINVLEVDAVKDIPDLDQVDFYPPETVKFRSLSHLFRIKLREILKDGSTYARAWAVAAIMHSESYSNGTLRLTECKYSSRK
jgi:hypothetical protein